MKPTVCHHHSRFLPDDHDHGACIKQAVQKAADLCRQRGARLTPQRRRVLELVWKTHQPVGAYEILADLQQEMRAAPPTVYRALDFLQQQGLIHRLASLNAFIGCSAPERPHNACFLICRCCKGTQPLEQELLSRTIEQQAADKGFVIEQQIVEILGLCPECRDQEKTL